MSELGGIPAAPLHEAVIASQEGLTAAELRVHCLHLVREKSLVPGFRQIAGNSRDTSKGMVCVRIREFESFMPSQPVRSLWAIRGGRYVPGLRFCAPERSGGVCRHEKGMTVAHEGMAHSSSKRNQASLATRNYSPASARKRTAIWLKSGSSTRRSRKTALGAARRLHERKAAVDGPGGSVRRRSVKGG
jgi:hypothetical protein